jgi:predicted metal-dependent hydrolase
MSHISAAPRRVHEAVSITPRNIRFVENLPDPATWLGGDIVGTAVHNALSLTFPDGERMFMDAVRHFKPLLNGDLLEDANAFIAQEAIHTREHVSLNKVMDGGHYPLDTIRAHIKNECELAEKLGPMTQLAATISLEHFTAMLGNHILSHPELMDGTPDDIKRLWQWHALEETEHKAVAFDVFLVATRNWSNLQRYFTRVQAMVITTVTFTRHLTYYATLLLHADGMSRSKARWRVLCYLFGAPGFFRNGLNGYWNWYKPGFHPWQHDNRALLDSWRTRFAAGQGGAPAE